MEIRNLQRETEATNGGELERRKKETKVVEGIGQSPSLPTDVVFEVLMRLSVKELFKWKFLSKAWWHSIILDHPGFSDAYRRHNPRVLVISNHSWEETTTFRRFFHYCSLGDGESHEFVLTSSLSKKSIHDRYFGATPMVDGLVCLHDRNNVHLHHTFTGEVMRLPCPPKPNLLGFGPIDYGCSLGFDPINGEYKLLRMVRSSHDIQTYILKLGTNSSWRKLPNTDLVILLEIPTLLTDGFLVDGVLYWKTLGNQILSFNLNKEEFILIPAPENFSLLFCYFAQLGGRLSTFSDSIYRGNVDELDLYVLHYNNRRSDYLWTKIIISLPTGLQNPASLDFYRKVIPVGNLSTGEILLARPDVSGDTLIIYSYNDENNKFKIFTTGNLPDSVYSLRTFKDSNICISSVEPNFESLHSLIHRRSREIM